MATGNRLTVVILEVADLARSVELYREGFGVDLVANNNGGDDRWISGPHAEVSWRDGAYLHFALFQAKGDDVTRGAQIGIAVDNLAEAHETAMRAGARLIHEPRPEPWGATARYYDYDGNTVSLTQAHQ